ncbi:MAG: helix-turn-helix transcriptional regulator [Lachnospiraceae bacterium]|nr:helix-turn-helix transcriptional regulator [Lachnospiraceae bacterium]
MTLKKEEPNENKTVFLKDAVIMCDDIEDLKTQIIPMLKSQQEQWSNKINSIIADNGYTKKDFATKCGVSRVTVDKWCKGSIPKSRETFLRIGMAAHYDIADMNQLLMRYGQYPGLYVKSLEDCVCMFVLNNGYGDEASSKYQYILEKIKDNIINPDNDDKTNVNTDDFNEQLLKVSDENELDEFIYNNSALFSYAYHRFYAYVKMCINANYREFASSVFDMAEGQGWSSSLKQCVSAIRQNKWYPTRNKIISLGLHLSMDHDQIDEMLALAHMEPLCAKNIFETVVMYILEDASINNMLDVDAEEYDPDELCRYAKQVMTDMEIPEIEAFISELEEIDDEW